MDTKDIKRVLVTGCFGFISSHVIEELRDQGIIPIGLSRHTEPFGPLSPDITYIGDIKDKNIVEKAVSMSDGVINLAGILGTQETVNNPYPSVESNIIGALNVLEACRLWKKPMVQISVGNYWMNNSYSITKSAAERFALMYAKEHGVKVNVVRAFNAFGERQKSKPVRKMMAYFITQALNNEDIGIYGDGRQNMDFIYVGDVANILIDVLKSDEVGQVYEAGTGVAPTVSEWAQKVIELTGSQSKIVYNPMRPGEPEHSIVKATEPYKFEYSNIDESILKTIEWYKKNVK